MGAVIGTYATTFYIWHRYVGYGSRPRDEQTYAKNVKMLRNMIITEWIKAISSKIKIIFRVLFDV